jgi:uncharacterized protein involved in outer membrane biogenesis
MRTYKIVFIVLIGLVLVAVAAVAALIFVDPSIYRNQLETRASEALSREFKIAGPIHLERSLRPRIIVEDITIGNPDWATGTHFATAEKVGVQVALFPLLRGELRVLDTAFSGVNLYIEEGPDGANNYTFGTRGEGDAPGVLPPIEQLLVRETIINYQSVDGSSQRFEIKEARLWNIPGEPERIEARGAAKGKTYNILLAADNAAELSGPQNPWSLKLHVEGPDMSLTLAGKMDHALKWEQGDYHIKLSGNQIDSLETLFSVALPTTGPFELSANVNKYDRSFRVTEIAARVQGPPETAAIKISNGEASVGQDDPLQVRLQGQLDDISFAFTLASTQTLKGVSKTTAWPIEAQLNIDDAQLNIDGTVIPKTVAERFEFDAHFQGETFKTLARILDIKLPEAGPYQLSFHSKLKAKSINVTELEGTIEQAGPWQVLRIEGGNASVDETGSVQASLKTRLDKVPLSMSFKGGPGAPEKTAKKAWPLKIEASASGATIKGDGAVITSDKGKVWQLATRISGTRFESLGPLIGTSLPAIGKFNLSADVSSDGDVHEASNLQIQVKKNRLFGNARWEDKAPRPLLTGKLASNRLTLSEFDTPSKPSSKTGTTGLMDRPIKLDGLKTFDARLDFEVKSLAGSPIPVEDIRSTVTLTKGELSALFRASLADVPVNGQIQFHQRKNFPVASLEATAGKIDVGQTLKQLKMPEMVSGTADEIDLKAGSTGRTLRALLAQPAFTLQIKPANLNYPLEFINLDFDIQIESAQIVAEKDQPLTGAFNGMLRGASFSAEISTANLMQLRKAGAPLPLQASLQSNNVQFEIQGSIARPFEKNEFELNYNLSGTEIQGLDPLADFVLPLRGAFKTRGRVTAKGNRFTYEEDLQIGKSDFKVDIAVLKELPRTKFTGHVTSSLIHMDDVQLIQVDKEAAPATEKSRVIPDYTFPIDNLFHVDADVEIKAERVVAELGDLGEIFSKITLKDGQFKSSHSVTGFTGAQVSGEFDVDASVNPPHTRLEIDAKNLNFGFLLSNMDVTDTVEGKIDLLVELSGSGARRYDLLGNAEGHITIIGGPGRISGRRIDLWAADLVPTMLSSKWQREDVTETNCLVAHIKVKEGQAEIQDLLLDTQRITIASSGMLDLETEEIDVIMAPRPKRASLVSLANPVRIQGTLAEPEVSVTRLPRRGRLAGTGLLAGLINPAFLIFAMSDSGTREANPCDVAVQHVRESAGIDSQEGQNAN